MTAIKHPFAAAFLFFATTTHAAAQNPCEVQQQLLAAGYQAGWVAWLTEEADPEAIAHYQREKRLAESGTINEATLAALIEDAEFSFLDMPITATITRNYEPTVDAQGCLTVTSGSEKASASNAKTDNTAREGSSASTQAVVSDFAIEEIVVTGEKLGRTLQETTTAVSVFSAVDIEDQGDNSVMEMLNRAANTSSNEEGRISIRGIEDGGAFGGVSSLVSVQVDGSTLDGTSKQGSATQLFDVAQVEVLRGAQSTSQGRNALAGAVIINTQDPTWEWQAKVQTSDESRNGESWAAAVGGPITNSLAFRLVGQTESSDGFITHTPTNNDSFARSENEVARLKLAFEPVGSRFKSLLTISRNTAFGQPAYNMEKGTAGTDPDKRRTSTVNETTYDDSTSKLASWKNEFEFNEHFSLTSITGAMDSNHEYFRDFDGTEDEGGRNEIFVSGDNVTHELRFNIDFPGHVSGLFGFYAGDYNFHMNNYSYDVRASVNDVQNIGLLGAIGEVEIDYFNDNKQNARNQAFFTEFDIELPWALTATVGLRYDQETLDIENETETTRAEAFINLGGALSTTPLAGTPLIDALNDIRNQSPGANVDPILRQAGILPTTNGRQFGTTKYDALLPKLGLRHAINDQWTVFATYTEAYRAGGVDIDQQNGEQVPYDPEFTENYEIGLRAELFDSALQLGLNLFHIDWRDQQVKVRRQIFFVTENAGSSELQGADFKLNWIASDNLSLYSSLGWVETEYKEYNDNGNSFAGNEFPFAPKFTASLGGTYRNHGFMASANISHRDESFSQPSNSEDDKADARQILNARIGIERENAQFYIYGRNLLDQDYLTEAYQFPNGYPSAPGARGYAAYGEPLTLGVQLAVQFN